MHVHTHRVLHSAWSICVDACSQALSVCVCTHVHLQPLRTTDLAHPSRLCVPLCTISKEPSSMCPHTHTRHFPGAGYHPPCMHMCASTCHTQPTRHDAPPIMYAYMCTCTHITPTLPDTTYCPPHMHMGVHKHTPHQSFQHHLPSTIYAHHIYTYHTPSSRYHIPSVTSAHIRTYTHHSHSSRPSHTIHHIFTHVYTHTVTPPDTIPSTT